MKLTELMIGDWVYLYGDPIKINIDDLGLIDRDDTYDNGEHCRPIPLTAEILEKNNYSNSGFEEDKYHLLEISDWRGKIWWSIAMGEYNIIELQYVHQLQHALKLCGIEKEIIV